MIGEPGAPAPPVTLREVTAETVCAVADLELTAAQQAYVAPNALSIAQAHFEPGAWFRAVYADEQPAGFVMLFDPLLAESPRGAGMELDEVALWRFMIDQRFQGKGIGRQALDLICAQARSRPGKTRLVASYVPGPDGPEGFYLKYGFAKTGRKVAEGREIEIALAL